MPVNLDNIYFYQPTPVVRQRAPNGTGQQCSNECPSITEEVASHPKIGSCTYHGDESTSTNSGDFASEVHLEMFGCVHAPNDTNSSYVSGDSTPMKTPAVLEEPTDLGLTRDTRAAQPSAVRSLVNAPIPTTSQSFTLSEASSSSLPEICHELGGEGNAADPHSTVDRAQYAAETNFECSSADDTSPSRWEQQTASSRGSQGGNFPAWLECCRSLPTGKGHTQAVSEPVMTVSEMPDSLTWSIEDEPMSSVSSPSVTSSPQEGRYGITTRAICQAGLGRMAPGKTTAPSAERPLGNPGEPEREATAERYSTKYISPPAPQEVIGPRDAIHVSSTATPPSAPPTPALRRSLRGNVPAGGYAEVESDAESDAGENVNISPNEDQTLVRRSTPFASRGQLGNKRRRTCLHEEPVRDSSASKKLCRSKERSTHSSKTRRGSRRIAEHKKGLGVVNTLQSEGASHEPQGADHVLASFDEFPLHPTPLDRFVLKRTIVDNVATFTIEWQQEIPQHRCQVPAEVAWPSNHSNPDSELAGSPTIRRRAFSEDEEKLLRDLKRNNLPWKEIHRQFSAQFPGRSVGTLQVHYSTKLKHLN